MTSRNETAPGASGTLTRRQTLALGGAAALASVASPARSQQVVVPIGTFAGANYDIIRTVALPMFQSSYPNVEVRLTQRPAAEQYPRLLVNRNNPPESGGMWNDTFSALGSAANLFERFNPEFVPNTQQLVQELQPRNGLGIAVAVQPYGIIYNPRYVQKPTSWFDLFKPEYAGRVAMHYNFWDQYVGLAYAMGRDERALEAAVEEWAKHKRNIGLWTTNFPQLEEAVDKGDMWLGGHWGGFAVAAQRRGMSVAFSWPNEGATQQTIIAHVAKGISAPVSEMTQRFLNTWLTPELQAAYLRGAGLSPSNRNVTVPPEFAELDGVITPERLRNRRLIQYDYAVVGQALPQLRRLIDEKLR